MNRRFLCAFAALLLVSVSPILAAKEEPPPPRPVPPGGDAVFRADSAAKAVIDTVIVYGGPGTLEGKFELADHLTPDPQGWTSHDITYAPNPLWNISDFNCADLDPGVPGNHAWWCGQDYDPCDGDLPGGYGSSWNESLLWSRPVDDAGQDVDVTLTCDLKYDTEPFYDYLHLEYYQAGSDTWMPVTSWDGLSGPVAVDVGFVVGSADYDAGGMVRLRFRFVSDYAWDASDCGHANDGAAQIDNIAVFFSQDGGPAVQIGDVENCEPGTTPAWEPEVEPGVGDYASLEAGRPQLDPCIDHANPTPCWAFTDPGYQTAQAFGYDPGTASVNGAGGALGPGFHIDNEIWSPPIAIPAGRDGCEVSFDHYLHNDLLWGSSSGVYASWGIRSSSDGVSWSNWSEYNYFIYGGPQFRRERWDASEHLQPGAQYVQVALGVRQIPIYTWGDQTTPAPYFDNVAVRTWERPDLMMSARTLDLAQDAFPADGSLTGTVPFDAVRNEASYEEPPLRGEQLVVTIEEKFPTGLQVPSRIEYRTAAGAEGWYPAEAWDPLLDEYRFDIPDGTFFPGDVVHYRFVASGPSGDVTLPAGPEGSWEDFSAASSYPAALTWRALPSQPGGGQVPVLLWAVSHDSVLREWILALDDYGLVPGVDYDVFRTGAIGSGASNGLGNMVGNVEVQLQGYETVLVTGGSTAYGAFDEDDAAAIGIWADTRPDRAELMMSGNHTAQQLDNLMEGNVFCTGRLGLTVAGVDVGAYTGTLDQTVTTGPPPFPADPLFPEPASWLVSGACPALRTFDEIFPVLGGETVATFAGGVYPAAVRMQSVNSAIAFVDAVTFPYDLAFTEPLPSKALPGLTFILDQVLETFEVEGSGGGGGGGAAIAAVLADPGPLNCDGPQTVTFTYTPETGAPDLRGYAVTFQVTGGVAFDADDLDDAGSLAALGPHAYFEVDEGGGMWSVHDALLGGAVGLAAPADLFTLVLEPTGDGTVTVDVTAVELRDLDNRTIPSTSAGASYDLDCTPPGAVGDLAAATGHEQITLTWTMADESDVDHYAVFRSLWYDGDDAYASAYPEYDDLDNDVIPPRPADHAAAVADPAWTPLSDVPSGTFTLVDGVLPRGVYHYEVFAVDAVGNAGPRADAGVRAMNYRLGDFDPAYDGTLDSADISVLGATYGYDENDPGYNNEVDIGPTDDYTGLGFPLTDSVVDFEDLMIFALNYGVVGKVQTAGSLHPVLAWEQVEPGLWELRLAEPCADLKGLRLAADLPDGTVSSLERGELLDRQPTPVFLANAARDGLDAGLALLGREAGIVGAGVLLRVTVPESVDLSDAVLTVRGIDNKDRRVDGPPPPPTAFAVRGIHPNPFNPKTTFSFDLPAERRVRLAVYALDGSLVRTLLAEPLPAGRYDVEWDGRDQAGHAVAAGAYFFRIDTGREREVRKTMLVK